MSRRVPTPTRRKNVLNLLKMAEFTTDANAPLRTELNVGDEFVEDYDSSEDFDNFDDVDDVLENGRHFNRQAPLGAKGVSTLNPGVAHEESVQKLNSYMSRIHVEDGFEGPSKLQSTKDKSDRATSEQVLDPRTRMILLKMINSGAIYEINGCISTGKEANVYHAITETGEHRAIKIYKTSILVFKDRDRYVSGEFRFRHGYNRRNPRKMVKTWAEKEMRNLKRVYSSGIPSPEPLALKQHVLLMKFLGNKSGWPYPRLKDAGLSAEDASRVYRQVARHMRTLYHVCHLVHADLSEYNMLYHKGKVYIIDVSQSVEHDHPHSLEFLRMDITNVTTFFRRLGAATLPLSQLYQFITEEGSVEKADMQQRISELFENQLEENEEDEKVFLKSYIPQTLEQVYDIDRDTLLVHEGQGSNLVYSHLLSTAADTETQNDEQTVHESEDENEDNSYNTEDGSESNPDSAGEESEIESDKPRAGKARKQAETAEEKRARKQKVREEKREKRKNKMSKYEKKRRIKNSSAKK
ncbi:atypical/RIO/RIO1 protein kinase [Schizosaccharomyces japonicus yFS275]|uniref:Serine/threonine-protein kinase RIO1 n=1 Tax=Schizosaccharomyces japonicus (strain yFS275 / FY16936) TaxID=402676 RepID=B6K8E0_SCHJY|nr:atypical/RIO/RIO1 protein kinase [Schizosaccharomyces japonicus yFS275]EEB09794.1 atypical/RIO/RIO1 protein kinase [Schizosaccharomyces japonicus yFS275]